MKKMSSVHLLVLLFLGCNSEGVTTANKIAETIELQGHAPQARLVLKPGETGIVPMNGMKVFFINVPQDSRCPVDVTCVWEGDALLNMTVVSQAEEKVFFTLHSTGVVGQNYFDAFGWRIALYELTPTPRDNVTIPQNQYEAQLDIFVPGIRKSDSE